MAEFLMWLDIEGTGLDAHKHSICEVAWGFTTLQLAEVPGAGTPRAPDSLVISPSPGTVWDPVPLRMHEESGLIKEMLGVETVPLYTAEHYILNSMLALPHLGAATVSGNIKDSGHTIYLAGSSCRYDRDMIEVHMPKLSEALHYRIYDVSSHILNFRSTYPEHEHLLPKSPDPKPHRAAADIRNSYKQASALHEEWKR